MSVLKKINTIPPKLSGTDVMIFKIFLPQYLFKVHIGVFYLKLLQVFGKNDQNIF
jgi:hypothetical protein